MPLPLTIQCPPGIPARDTHRLGRIARMPGFGVINRVLGRVVLAGQFTAINVILPFVFLPLFDLSENLVVRVVAAVMTAWVLWGVWRLVARGVRIVVRRRIVRLELFVWAAGLVLMLLLSARLATEV